MGKDKGKVKKGDKPKLKRPLAAYMYFCAEEREKVKKQCPGLGTMEIARETGKRWRGLPESHKKKYQASALKDRQRYEREKQALQAEKGPKRPLSGYMFFATEIRPKVKQQYPHFGVPEIGKTIGNLWNRMTDKDKVRFQDKAKVAKAKYEVDVAKWKAKKGKK